MDETHNTDVADLLDRLAGIAGQVLSTPERPVTCAVVLFRERKAPVVAGDSGDGAQCALRVPVLLADGDSAFLTFFSERTEAFDAGDSAAAAALADQMSRPLQVSLRLARLETMRDDLTAAMQTRSVIDMAVGAIMTRNRCGRDAACETLRNASNNSNTKLRDVAARLISSIAGDAELPLHFDGL